MILTVQIKALNSKKESR